MGSTLPCSSTEDEHFGGVGGRGGRELKLQFPVGQLACFISCIQAGMCGRGGGRGIPPNLTCTDTGAQQPQLAPSAQHLRGANGATGDVAMHGSLLAWGAGKGSSPLHLHAWLARGTVGLLAPIGFRQRQDTRLEGPTGLIQCGGGDG